MLNNPRNSASFSFVQEAARGWLFTYCDGSSLVPSDTLSSGSFFVRRRASEPLFDLQHRISPKTHLLQVPGFHRTPFPLEITWHWKKVCLLIACLPATSERGARHGRVPWLCGFCAAWPRRGSGGASFHPARRPRFFRRGLGVVRLGTI